MIEEPIIVSLEIGELKVKLEGPRDVVEPELRRLTTAAVAKQETQLLSVGAVPEPMSVLGSEREFIAAKGPSGHIEIATALGFYLTEHGQKEFTDDEIRRAYIRAGVRPPKVVSQALRDAKNRKDYLEQGSSRGTYRLTDHGENFVRFDLGV